jgi:uncharacterized membrane protein YraQ (UPF0718 family)
MDVLTIVFWLVSIILLVLSMIKKKEETLKSIKKSKNMMKHMMPSIISIILIIGIILTVLPAETISTYFGDESSISSVVIASTIGSITIIPAFVAFPLVASFINSGANVMSATAFLTTLTMVGVATFPLEKEQFGTKFALYRNGLSFLFSIVIAVVMGVIII